jgi:uncharacterized protein involved in type VI secretion and phage assembly
MFDEIFQDNNIKENNVCGIVTGFVKEIYDGKHPGMVKVEMFMTDGTLNITDWIRVIVPYGGKDKGMYFLPDVGDEVAIAFERGDIEKPYVIGCLWNANVDTIPENTVTEQNTIKKLKTKGGHEVIFDDTKEKGKLQIITPKKSKIVMDDENSLITISAAGEKGENILKLDSKQGVITITGKKKIVLDAGGTKITIDGTSKKIDIEGDNINLKGKNIKEEGQAISIKGTQTEINAAASLNVKSDATVNIKGVMVKIN